MREVIDILKDLAHGGIAGWMILSCFAAIPIAIAAALYHNYAHNKFLKQNGCQVQFQAEPASA